MITCSECVRPYFGACKATGRHRCACSSRRKPVRSRLTNGCIRKRRAEPAGFTPSGIAQWNGPSRVGSGFFADFNFRVLSGPTGSNWRPRTRRGPRGRRRNSPPTRPKLLRRLGRLTLGARLRRSSRSVWSGFRPDVSEIALAALPLACSPVINPLLPKQFPRRKSVQRFS
jgi:hypothetical protein